MKRRDFLTKTFGAFLAATPVVAIASKLSNSSLLTPGVTIRDYDISEYKPPDPNWFVDSDGNICYNPDAIPDKPWSIKDFYEYLKEAYPDQGIGRMVQEHVLVLNEPYRITEESCKMLRDGCLEQGSGKNAQLWIGGPIVLGDVKSYRVT